VTAVTTPTQAEQERLTVQLWAGTERLFADILAHPFVAGLTSGALDRERFGFYVVQDAHYLRAYAKALAVLAARAPDPSTTSLFSTHAASAIAVEQALHEEFLHELGLADPQRQPPPTPTTVAYSSYLLATAYGGSFAEGLAAVLPCYWIYWEVGKTLVDPSSPNPLYSRWIETYGGEEFGEVVRPVLALTDRVGEDVPPAESLRMHAHFATTARYEWMFWDAAYRLESWPL